MSVERGNPRARRRSRARGFVLIRPDGYPAFDRETLDLLDQRREVDIQTVRLDGRTYWTRIWIVVDGDGVYVRSVRGDRGHWYQSASERPHQVALRAAGRVIPVRAVHAADEESIRIASAGFEAKYSRSRASLLSMVQPNTLETTLRLEPR
ncbi:MAG: DUF2255 family protein [Candidatus Limnocylindrales bacterium]